MDKKVKNPGYVINIKMVLFSLLICTLRSDFEGGRKVVLVGDPEKKAEFLLRTNRPSFFHGEEPEKNPSRTTLPPPSKSFLRMQIKRLFGFYD